MPIHTFVCSTCGQEHSGLPTDFGFRLPDEVSALSYIDRYVRSHSNSDLCTFDGSRYFLRGLIAIPLTETDEQFCWGIWAEVSKETHDFYVKGFNQDLKGSEPREGQLSNTIPGYEETSGLGVLIHFQDTSSRPTFLHPSDATHALAHEQRGGISAKRHHDILANVGHFEKHKET